MTTQVGINPGKDAGFSGHPAPFLTQVRQQMETLLAQAFDHCVTVSDRLLEAMRYSSLDGGKRIRPALMLASARCCALPDAEIHSAMVAVELLHCFSLVHDDLPCMDDDHLRRGRPSTHARFDQATALLAGDALQVLAIQQLLKAPLMSERNKVRSLDVLCRAIGANGMIGGQMLDMQLIGDRPDAGLLSKIHQRKTGALIRACCELPSILLDDHHHRTARLRSKLALFGHRLGVGFQIVDDILDDTSTSEDMGKPNGSDQSAGHLTYTGLYGIDGAREQAEQCRRSALDHLAALDGSTDALHELTELIFNRIA